MRENFVTNCSGEFREKFLSQKDCCEQIFVTIAMDNVCTLIFFGICLVVCLHRRLERKL